ncbi:MAG TPA: serine hydrolase [Bryobacteraceae bacterium]|nr:serine hydrolase [Bryobacteraceae bacterium]
MLTRRAFLASVSTAAAQSRDPRFDAAFQCARESTANGGLLVLNQGRPMYERYYGLASPQATPNLASVGKSFTSIGCGILIGQQPGKFPRALDTLVCTPEYLPAAAFPLSDEQRSAIQLGQLLSMSAGLRGNNPCLQHRLPVTIDPAGPDGWEAMVDETAYGQRPDAAGRTAATLWCKPGAGYSYATVSPQLASIIIRHVSGMELEEFLRRHIAVPLDFGTWGFGYRNRDLRHTPGGGGICLTGRDLAKFGELLRNRGRLGLRQIVPESFIATASRTNTYNPHSDYSLQFDTNTSGTRTGIPRDAFWKTGSGGHVLYVVPSLGLTAVKLGGRDGQYDPRDTGLPLPRSAGDPNPKPTRSEADAAVETLRLLCNA